MKGYDITYLPVKQDGLIDMAQLEAAIRPDTALVSIMTVNNEIGEALSATQAALGPCQIVLLLTQHYIRLQLVCITCADQLLDHGCSH